MTFPYVPEHLYYILMELLKNGLRAVTENTPEGQELPPVKVIVVEDYSLTTGAQIVIKISDEGELLEESVFV